MLHIEERKLISAQSIVDWAKERIHTLALRLEALED